MKIGIVIKLYDHKNKNAKIPYEESEMSRFTRFFLGKFLYFVKYAGVKYLTNVMSALICHHPISLLSCPCMLSRNKEHIDPIPKVLKMCVKVL